MQGMFKTTNENEIQKVEIPKKTLRSHNSAESKLKPTHKKMKCHYCQTKDTSVSYLLCANYPNCRCGFCFSCLMTYFPSSVESNPGKFRSGKWVCIVCQGLCDCQRCSDRQRINEEKSANNNQPEIKEGADNVFVVKEWRKVSCLQDEKVFGGPKKFVKKPGGDSKKVKKPIKQEKRATPLESSSESSDYLPNSRNTKKIHKKSSMKRKSFFLRKNDEDESDSYEDELDSKSIPSKKENGIKHKIREEGKKGIKISASQNGSGKVVLTGINQGPRSKIALTKYNPSANIPEIPLSTQKPNEMYKQFPSFNYTSIYQSMQDPNNRIPTSTGIGQLPMNYPQTMQASDVAMQYMGMNNYPMQYGAPTADPQAIQPSLYPNSGNPYPYSQGSYLPIDPNSMMLPGMAYNPYADPNYYPAENYSNPYSWQSLTPNMLFNGSQFQGNPQDQKNQGSVKSKSPVVNHLNDVNTEKK